MQTITVSEDVILGRGFDSLELLIGEAEVLGWHEIALRRWFGIPKISTIWAGIPEWLELKTLKSAETPVFSGFQAQKKTPMDVFS